ncbi:MAG: efflux RND transporter permease subunit [Thermodesulfobacteriota bacterium]
MPHRDDNDIIASTHNTARFFTEKRQISWVLLIAVLAWGVYGWLNMPKRKDPDIPVLIAVATCPWPGADAAKVEQLVTKPMEETIAQNSYLHEPDPGNEFAIKSTSLPGMAIVQVQLSEDLKDTTPQFNDINLRLDYLNNNLPNGAGPIKFNSGFGNTAAMMLTVASPKESGVEIAVRARNINKAIESMRSQFPPEEAGKRMTFVVALPGSIDAASLGTVFEMLSISLTEGGMAKDPRVVSAPGFIALDAEVTASPGDFLAFTKRFSAEKLGLSGFHVDAWEPVLIGNAAETEKKLGAVAGDKYSYSDLENVTELITEVLQSVEEVSIIERSGVLPQRVYLDYSQEELASYGILPADIKQKVNARNTDLPGGEFDVGGSEVLVYPSGQFTDPGEIGGVVISKTPEGVPVYLRDLFEITRGYQDPPTFLNFYSWRDKDGKWRRSRAITLAVQMRKDDQIEKFGEALDQAKAELQHIIPRDLIIAKTSDQPEQVQDNMDLFMEALVEAIILVVLVAWFGFREWRSALLMALSIPITLSMTFGLMYLLGIDLQQVSIATLIIALGLLVDDPVVANDAIKSNLALGHPPEVASWLGPTKLARAIMFATVTNIVAYLPYLMLTGTTGEFLYSLPVVMACALVSSRLVSMTFIPFLGFYLLRAGKKPEETIEEKRTTGFYGFYHRVGKYAIEHRKKVLAFSLAFFVLGGLVASRLASSFFPEDVEYLSYVDVWLPNGVALSQTNAVAAKAEEVIEEVTREYGVKEKRKESVLDSVTAFVGGGGPRFWYTLSPEQQQTNYAQIILKVSDKDDTPALAPVIQKALSGRIPGAYFEVRQLQLNPVDYPIQIHISGRSDISSEYVSEAEDIGTLRRLSEELKGILRKVPETMSVRDDWFEDSFRVRLDVDPDRANLSGITNEDVAVSSAAGLSGAEVTVYQEGDKQIPVLARLRVDERAELSDLQSLYVYASDNEQKIPLLEVSSVNYGMEVSRIMRREHFRTISVIGFPEPGAYPSTILGKAGKEIDAFEDSLPPGYQMVYGGEKAKQIQGFRNLTTVLIISVLAIFVALVLQFNNAVKPFLVFAAVPYGVVGSLAALLIMREAFGFMAFLGIASLVGVIVSHVIVLFDFIEVKHEEGEPFEDSLLDAGIARLRPVLITVGATILALFPLAIHGGPLWQPLCYAQIGGLALATVIELVLVPVFYAVFVLDLKIIKWGKV